MTELAEPTRVRVAVLTYRRPQDLAAVLPRLVAQAESLPNANQGASLTPDILVVDNDPAGGARSFVEGFAAAHLQVPVRYEHEAAPGISSARNRAFSASEDIDLLVFIDDDERPSEAWLIHLLGTYQRYRPAAVVGPVISEYEVEPDAWVRAGRFFDRRRLPTGAKVDVAATNNLLLDLRQVRARGLTFDERFGLRGGGDTMFTRSLHAAGGELVWCDEAIVIDVVPAARVTREWVLKRAFRSGESWSATSLQLATSGGRRSLVQLKLSVRGLVRLVGGGVQVAGGAVSRSLAHRARGRRTIARGAGMVSGAWGHVYTEYARP